MDHGEILERIGMEMYLGDVGDMNHGEILGRIGIWWRSIKPSIPPRPRARRRQHFGSGRSDEYSEGGYGELNGDDLARSHGLILPRSRGFGDKQPLKRSWATSFVMVPGRRAYLGR
ncbi:hypothetical protein Acr_03g0009770 [Actinidia rufa]|uniref:Uncharacterized protein n=1 Tax=Actinidia rufa TaxID=165716 RepID=A0A7J0ECK4_9ERIC|nr:hypothetical protein Acr_03g0009770 [Actinidia rufa]